MAEKKVLNTDPALVGKKIFLRSLTPDDAANLQHWRILSSLQTLSSHPMVFLTPSEAADRASKRDEKDPYNQRFGIVRIEDLVLVGGINMFNHNPLNRSVELGLIMDPDARQKGFGTEAVRLLCRYLFRYLALNKVHAQTAAFNKGTIKLLEGLAFKRDAVLRDHYFHDGEFHAGYIYSLLSFEFE